MSSFDFGQPSGAGVTLEALLARDSCVPGKQKSREARGSDARDIVRVIEGEIIPRLILARRYCGCCTEGAETLELGASHVEELTKLLLTRDDNVPLVYVRELLAEGASLGAVYRDLLGPVARRLGELWSSDHCSFFEVTVALSSLHQLLHALSRESGPIDVAEGGESRRVLLVPAPGEQHCFGLMMVGDAFRRAGWDVRFESPVSVADLVRLVRQEPLEVLGISVGCDTPLGVVGNAIHSVRRASANRELGILVGGSIIDAQPGLAARLGADATAEDGPSAVAQAEKLLRLLSART